MVQCGDGMEAWCPRKARSRSGGFGACAGPNNHPNRSQGRNRHPPSRRGPVPVCQRDNKGSEGLDMVPGGGEKEAWSRGTTGSRGGESGTAAGLRNPIDRFHGHSRHPPSCRGPTPVIPRDREVSGGSEMVPDGGRMEGCPGGESGTAAEVRDRPNRFRGPSRHPPQAPRPRSGNSEEPGSVRRVRDGPGWRQDGGLPGR